jgi:hypothetical protein
MSGWRSILRALDASGLRFVTIGTRALALLHPARFADEDPGARADVDILISPDDLQRFAAFIEGMGGEVTSWGEPFARALEQRSLAGRFYVRAQLPEAQLDATYESDWLSLDALYPRATRVDEIPACPESMLWITKLVADPLKAERLAAERGLEIPRDARERVFAALRKNSGER